MEKFQKKVNTSNTSNTPNNVNKRREQLLIGSAKRFDAFLLKVLTFFIISCGKGKEKRRGKNEEYINNREKVNTFNTLPEKLAFSAGFGCVNFFGRSRKINTFDCGQGFLAGFYAKKRRKVPKNAEK